MGRKGKRHRGTASPRPVKRRGARFTLLVLLCAAMGGVVALVVFDRTREMGEPRHHAPPVPGYAQRAASLDALLKMTPEQLAGVDIAEMNLPCAAGLPGGETLDVGRCLALRRNETR